MAETGRAAGGGGSQGHRPAIGNVFGRTSTHDFKFKVETSVKKWDYIAIQHPEIGAILGQVNEIKRDSNATIADCAIIGYRVERGFLRKPRTPLEPGTNVFHASDQLVVKTLGLASNGLYIGLLEGREHLKAFVDPKKLITKHLAILAKSGAGKSYTVGVLLEELAHFGVPVVILDPHGEYSSIKYSNDHVEDKKYLKRYDVTAKGFAKQTMEFAINTRINMDAHQLKLAVPSNPFDIVETMPFKVSSAQKGLLYSISNDLIERKGRIDFESLIKDLELSESTAKWRLIGGLQELMKTGLFSFSPTPINEIVKPGQITIINFKGAPVEFQEIAARALLHELFEERKLENIPPFFMIIEEAHNFCPDRGFGEAKSSKILRSISSEGRKFGLGICIISQRPARVDKSVLSQCTSQIALQVTNPNDLSAISKSFEGITLETEREIKNLPVGKALVIGASDHPILVDIRVRRSRHGGRAKIFEMAKPSTRKTTIKVSSTQATQDKMIYLFEPRISKAEVETLESKKVQSINMIFRPCLSVNCSKSGKEFHLLFDLVNSQLFIFRDTLRAVKIPTGLANLSPMQKKVLNVLSQSGKASMSDIFVKSGLGFSEVSSVVNTLARQGLVQVQGKMVAGGALNLSRLNFLDKPKYISAPAGEQLKARVSESKIKDFLKALGVQLGASRVAYLPFYQVKTSDGKRTIDALGYSLRI